MLDEYELADLQYEAAWERRKKRSLHSCQCGDDLPGTCPGPTNCPYSGFEGEEHE